MNKKRILYAIFALLFSVSGFTTNVVGNGDFESGVALGTSYWVPVSNSPGLQSISIDNTGQISGANCIKADVTTTGGYITRLGFYQFVSLPKASTYTVSFKAKASATCTVQSYCTQYFTTTSPGFMSPNITLSTTVQPFSYDITTTATPTGLCKLLFYYGAVPSGVSLYFDDITVVEKTQTTNRNLCNGDFETAMSNYLYGTSTYSFNGLVSGTPDATQNQLYDGWALNKYTSHAADMTATIDNVSPISGANSIKLTTTGTATTSTTDLMFTWAFAGQKDQLYTLSFKAKASAVCTLPFDIITLAYLDATSTLLSKSCDLTTAVQSFTFTTTQKFVQSSDGRALLRFQLGKVPNGVSIWLDDVVLVKTIPVTNVGISPSAITVSTGSVYPLTATITPYDANNQALTWTSNDNSKATVSPSGVVTAIAAGAVNITATSQDNGLLVANSAFTISATAVPVSGVTLSPATFSVNTGATQQLTAAVSPLGATNKTVTWASSNPAVATVDASGLVSGVAAGTVTISASSQDGALVGNATVTVVFVATQLSTPQIGIASKLGSKGFTANWTPVANASGYTVKIYYGTANIDSTNVTGQSISSADILNLVPNTTFSYKVIARGDKTNFTDSPLSSFSQTFTLLTAVIPASKLKIILRLDDIAMSGYALPIMDYLKSNSIKANFGVVAKYLTNTSFATLSPYLSACNAEGDSLVEIWHHGLDHSGNLPNIPVWEFKNTPYADQKLHFDSANNLVKSLLGIQMHTFAAPFNRTDTATNRVLASNPNYKMSMWSSVVSPNDGIFYASNHVDMELATGTPLYKFFVANYNSFKGSYTDYMQILGHPGGYAAGSANMDQFKLILQFLISEGVEFVRCYDYYRYLSLQAPGNLTGTALANNRVDLIWRDNATTETHFNIERSTDNINWTALATVPANETTYSDLNAAATSYYYRVYANCGMKSTYSNALKISNLTAVVDAGETTKFTVSQAQDKIMVAATLTVGDLVQCDLLNVSGQCIKPLFAGRVENADFRIIQNVQELKTGVYLCRLKTPQQTMVKKVLINK